MAQCAGDDGLRHFGQTFVTLDGGIGVQLELHVSPFNVSFDLSSERGITIPVPVGRIAPSRAALAG
jgi:hypothetical protein